MLIINFSVCKHNFQRERTFCIALHAIIHIFCFFSSISDLFFVRSLIFHFLSHERERDSICNVLANVRHRYPLKLTFFRSCPRSGVPDPARGNWPEARARVTTGIELSCHGYKSRTIPREIGIRWAEGRDRWTILLAGGLCMPVERWTGRRSCSSSVNDRVPRVLPASSKLLISGWLKTTQRRDPLLRMHRDATSDPAAYCDDDQGWRQCPWFKKETRLGDWCQLVCRWENDEEKNDGEEKISDDWSFWEQKIFICYRGGCTGVSFFWIIIGLSI